MAKTKIHYKNPINILWAVPAYFFSFVGMLAVGIGFLWWYVPLKTIQSDLVSNSEGFERVAKELNKKLINLYGFSKNMILTGKEQRSSCKSK